MVIVLFIQILVMVLERYINRTNTKQIIKKIGLKKDERELSEDDILAKLKSENMTPKTLSMHIDHTMTSDHVLMQHFEKSETGSLSHVSEKPRIILE